MSVPERRHLPDRRVGLPDPRPPGERVERRTRTRRPQPKDPAQDRAELRHLVLYLAASPVRVEWLRRLLARHLEAAAEALVAAGDAPGARVVRGVASRVRSGAVPPW